MAGCAITIQLIGVGSPVLVVGGVIPSAGNLELERESKLSMAVWL